jgi:integrase
MPKEIAEATGINANTVSKTCTRMVEDAQLDDGVIPRNPTLGVVRVRAAYSERSTDELILGPPVTAAKAYRLLRSILATAVEDRILEYNPCFIKGAASERSPERPTLTEREVFDLANGMEPRYRLLVLLAALGSLRWGELAGLQRRHIDGALGIVNVRQAVVELPTGELRIGPPKTESGRRDMEPPSLVWTCSSTWRYM